jgi:hypothetical protein
VKPRKLLHRAGREQGRREIDSQVAEMEEAEMFVCRACGQLEPMYMRSDSGECGYC